MKLALVALSLLPLVTACHLNECSLIGCGPALTLTIQAADDEHLPPSTYEIVLVLDGEPVALACGDAPEPDGWSCEDSEGTPSFNVRAYVDDAPRRIFIDIQGGEGGDIVGPRSVDIEVTAGDAPLADETRSPQYDSIEPNGEGCGRCEHADVDPIEIEIPM